MPKCESRLQEQPANHSYINRVDTSVASLTSNTNAASSREQIHVAGGKQELADSLFEQLDPAQVGSQYTVFSLDSDAQPHLQGGPHTNCPRTLVAGPITTFDKLKDSFPEFIIVPVSYISVSAEPSEGTSDV